MIAIQRGTIGRFPPMGVERMTEFKMLNASPVAMAKKEKIEYPFDTLQTGKCFTVPFHDDLSVTGLRNAASRAGKRLGCKFRVIKHDAPHNCYEVARVD